jgi:hypothetical protein
MVNDPSGRSANVTTADPPPPADDDAPEEDVEVPYGVVTVTTRVGDAAAPDVDAAAGASPPLALACAPEVTPDVALMGVIEPSGRAAKVTTSDVLNPLPAPPAAGEI